MGRRTCAQLLLIMLQAVAFCQSSQCPGSIQPCGFGCLVAPASICRDQQCYDLKGSRTLCSPASHTCGDDVCPLLAWCHRDRCVPNTCTHRHKLWCQDPGTLHEANCSTLQAPGTKCYDSTSGEFSCYVSQGLLVARCSKRMAAGLAAGPTQIISWERQKQLRRHHRRPWAESQDDISHSSILQRLQQSITWILAHRSRSLLQIPFSAGDAGLTWYPSTSSSSGVLDDGDDYPSGSGFSSYNQAVGSQALSTRQSRILGPSYGGLVPVSRFQPAIGSPMLPTGGGNSAGGLFIKTGTGGAVAGSYGGGWRGPYNSISGSHLPGASYGYPQPYSGGAAGTAVVFMPAANAPNSPNITYTCPMGAPVGTFISVGIPCGIPLAAVPAAQLAIVGGLPSGVDLQTTGLIPPPAPPAPVYTPPVVPPVCNPPLAPPADATAPSIPVPINIPIPTPTPIPVTAPVTTPTVTTHVTTTTAPMATPGTESGLTAPFVQPAARPPPPPSPSPPQVSDSSPPPVASPPPPPPPPPATEPISNGSSTTASSLPIRSEPVILPTGASSSTRTALGVTSVSSLRTADPARLQSSSSGSGGRRGSSSSKSRKPSSSRLVAAGSDNDSRVLVGSLLDTMTKDHQ